MQENNENRVPPAGGDDLDLKPATGTGGKIAWTIVILLVLGGLCAAAWFFYFKPNAERAKEIEAQDAFMTRYTAVKKAGYDAFWSCVFVGTDEGQIKDNFKFQSLIENAKSQNQVGFGKHILTCVDKLQGHIKAVGELAAPPGYTEKIGQLPAVLDAVMNSWKVVSDEFTRAGDRAGWDKRLMEVADKGWGQMYADHANRKKPADETMRNARRYMKFISCSLGMPYSGLGKTDTEVKEALVKAVLDGICSTDEKAMEVTRKIEDECVKVLMAPNPPEPDEEWDFVVKNLIFYEDRSIAVIDGSFDGREGCVTRAVKVREKLAKENLLSSWIAYKKVAKEVEDIYFAKMKTLKKR